MGVVTLGLVGLEATCRMCGFVQHTCLQASGFSSANVSYNALHNCLIELRYSSKIMTWNVVLKIDAF